MMGDKTIYYLREGDGRPPFVFVHGFGCAHDDFRCQMDAFRDRHTVVACDLRGHGESTGFETGLDIVTAASDVAGLVERLRLGPAVLVGHSMGCRAVLETASERPDLVAAVVFIEGSRSADGDEEAAILRARSALDATPYPDFVRSLFEGMFFNSTDASVRDPILARAATLPETAGRSYFESTMGYDAAHMDAALARLECRALVLQSTYLNEDRVRVALGAGETTPWTECIDRTATDSDVHVISRVGHFSMLEAPERINALIERFVAELSG
jgi:pimeloyl-ACP methyl ester carboxylesterase